MRLFAATFGLGTGILFALTGSACGGGPTGGDGSVPPAVPSNATASVGSTAPAGSTPPPLSSTDLAVPNVDGGTKLAPAPTKGEPGRGVEDIRTRVVAQRDAARACYDAGQKRVPSLEGKLVVKWTIDPHGNVRDVEVDESLSTIKDAPTSACVIDIIRKIKFPESGKGFETHANYPYDFHPKVAPPK